LVAKREGAIFKTLKSISASQGLPLDEKGVRPARLTEKRVLGVAASAEKGGRGGALFEKLQLISVSQDSLLLSGGKNKRV